MSNDTSSTFRRRDYVKITLFGFAVTALWQSLHSIVLPVRLLDFVPEAQKNTYLGLMTLSGLLLAMLYQPIAGAISDRSGSRWGRRRPFVLAGGLAAVLLIPGVGLAGGFIGLFVFYCLLQLASNTAQGPFQALIPDMVPPPRRGLASGVKALLEIVGGVVLVFVSSIFIDRYLAGAGSVWLWLVLVILAVILAAAAIFTAVVVKEVPAHTVGKRSSLLETLVHTAGHVTANRDMVWFLASRLLIYMAFTTIQQFALYFLRDVIGVADPAGATARFMIFAVAGMLVAVWPAGHLSDRIGRRPISFTAGLLGAAGIAIIALSKEYGTILWAAGLIGIAMGAFNSANWALATDLVPAGEEGRYLGIANMATAGGGALARGIGPAIDFFNRRGPNAGYDFLLVACMAYFFVGALLVLMVRGRTARTGSPRSSGPGPPVKQG
jgi:Na+/melibiose symporter-like transporter